VYETENKADQTCI